MWPLKTGESLLSRPYTAFLLRVCVALLFVAPLENCPRRSDSGPPSRFSRGLCLSPLFPQDSPGCSSLEGAAAAATLATSGDVFFSPSQSESACDVGDSPGCLLSLYERGSATAAGLSFDAYALLKEVHIGALASFVSFAQPTFDLRAVQEAHLSPTQRRQRLAATLRRFIRDRVKKADALLPAELSSLFAAIQVYDWTLIEEAVVPLLPPQLLAEQPFDVVEDLLYGGEVTGAFEEEARGQFEQGSRGDPVLGGETQQRAGEVRKQQGRRGRLEEAGRSEERFDEASVSWEQIESLDPLEARTQRDWKKGDTGEGTGEGCVEHSAWTGEEAAGDVQLDVTETRERVLESLPQGTRQKTHR
ncbi:hypothetical protein TGP89_201810 [Toxoplasma gondii p89]|uniref:Uncharacterized protein n=2 Tax=Toxoplasma gondii TaxID=5811 RepID=A0A2T6IW35_TOXGO|nr:hypothetical protein TGP89_201810 [Toxoplasma gondii p89]PUA89553.1 hypothetical protein TGBR9_201810 [Toxoplasma gondii TgCATBr9]